MSLSLNERVIHLKLNIQDAQSATISKIKYVGLALYKRLTWRPRLKS